MWTSQPEGVRPVFLGSTATTTHCAPKSLAHSVISSGVGDGGRVDAGLVRAGLQDAPEVFHGLDAAADAEGDEDLFGDPAGVVEHQVALLVRGRDVQKDQFVRALRVVQRGPLDGVAGIAQVEEVGAFDDAPVLDVQAGNDSGG